MGRYICPVCRAPRTVQLQDRLPFSVHFKILVTLFLLCALALLLDTPLLAFKLSLIYLPVWALCEFFHWSQQRRASKCPQCDFDPILYKQNWKEARSLVETRLNSIKADAMKVREEKKERFLRGHLPKAEVATTELNSKPNESKRVLTPEDLSAHLPRS